MLETRLPSLSIIIVNWNTGQLLRECISSIVHTKRDGFMLREVVVVDNGSTDDSLTGIDEPAIPFRIIRNVDNRGFAAACNQGAANVTADYLLFLNPDTRLFADTLKKPIEFMEQASGIGICGIQLVGEAGEFTTSAARFPTLRVMMGSVLGLNRILPNTFPRHLMTALDLQRSQPVDQVIGAFFLIRRDLFCRCRGFDERFFVYFEEVDLSLRAKQFGYASYFFADAIAFHRGGGSSDQVRAARLFYSLRSRLQFGRKHYSRVHFVMLVMLTGVELPLRLAQSLVRRSWGDIVNVTWAYVRLVVHCITSAGRV